MLICIKCKLEFKCYRTGVDIVCNENGHCYKGDAYECPGCGMVIVSLNEKPYHTPKHKEGHYAEAFVGGLLSFKGEEEEG